MDTMDEALFERGWKKAKNEPVAAALGEGSNGPVLVLNAAKDPNFLATLLRKEKYGKLVWGHLRIDGSNISLDVEKMAGGTKGRLKEAIKARGVSCSRITLRENGREVPEDEAAQAAHAGAGGAAHREFDSGEITLASLEKITRIKTATPFVLTKVTLAGVAQVKAVRAGSAGNAAPSGNWDKESKALRETLAVEVKRKWREHALSADRKVTLSTAGEASLENGRLKWNLKCACGEFTQGAHALKAEVLVIDGQQIKPVVVKYKNTFASHTVEGSVPGWDYTTEIKGTLELEFLPDLMETCKVLSKLEDLAIKGRAALTAEKLAELARAVAVSPVIIPAIWAGGSLLVVGGIASSWDSINDIVEFVAAEAYNAATEFGLGYQAGMLGKKPPVTGKLASEGFKLAMQTKKKAGIEHTEMATIPGTLGSRTWLGFGVMRVWKDVERQAYAKLETEAGFFAKIGGSLKHGQELLGKKLKERMLGG